MKLVVFGLAVTSSWGNGHATLWRALGRAWAARGHRLVFFEKDQPYYASHRDQREPPGIAVVLYADWASASRRARLELVDADAVLVTSFCPDAGPASDLALSAARPVRGFYDLDTPVTLGQVERGQPVAYLPPYGLAPFDLVLSYTGGRALEQLISRLGARRAVPFYGWVDQEVHRPVGPVRAWRGDLSFLGTYSADRQPALERLLLAPADRLPHRRFVLAGAQYPQDFPWRENLWFLSHLAPSAHAAFYVSCPLTLSVTRASMAALGYCPSPRFFEAAGCGIPVLSDRWEGLETFFEPGREVLVADTTEDAVAAIERSPGELREIGEAARARVMAQHTAARRAAELERLLFADDTDSLFSGPTWANAPAPG